MDEKFTMDVKKPHVHKIVGPIPELQKKCGLILMQVSHYCDPPDGFVNSPDRYFEFYSISHLLKGQGRCILEDGTDVIVKEGDAVVITPGVVNRYGGWEQSFEEEAITFFGPIADGLRDAGVIKCGVFPVGKDPFLLPLSPLVSDPSDNAQIHAVLELQKILVHLNDIRRQLPSDEDPVAGVLEQVRSDPERWWSVEEMAELCNLTVPRFRRHFHNLTGTNPKEFCEQLKLRRAAEMLTSGKAGLKKIAHSLGYTDEYHFARRFKHFFGMSPGRYRRNFG